MYIEHRYINILNIGNYKLFNYENCELKVFYVI